eukprot:TRINITY_DN421_c0_g1_i8.p1 TRINITY_DN421_c0_g1~~TRINITY_DN421_c0_g1_i8.p1  ORF type:complete len:568 (+),score=62.46 TRINITY_DN421_c0_g1_i8:275-1978(+)
MKNLPWWPCQEWHHMGVRPEAAGHRVMIEFLGEHKMAYKHDLRVAPFLEGDDSEMWMSALEIACAVTPSNSKTRDWLRTALQESVELLGLTCNIPRDGIKARQLHKEHKETFCCQCSDKTQDSKLLLCDGCNKGWHLFCLEPPLQSIPTGDWHCSQCSVVRDSPRDSPRVSVSPARSGSVREIDNQGQAAGFERPKGYIKHGSRPLSWEHVQYDAESDDHEWCHAHEISLTDFEWIIDHCEKVAAAFGRLAPPPSSEITTLKPDLPLERVWVVYVYWISKRYERGGRALLRVSSTEECEALRSQATGDWSASLLERSSSEEDGEAGEEECPHCGVEASTFRTGSIGLERHMRMCSKKDHSKSAEDCRACGAHEIVPSDQHAWGSEDCPFLVCMCKKCKALPEAPSAKDTPKDDLSTRCPWCNVEARAFPRGCAGLERHMRSCPSKSGGRGVPKEPKETTKPEDLEECPHCGIPASNFSTPMGLDRHTRLCPQKTAAHGQVDNRFKKRLREEPLEAKPSTKPEEGSDDMDGCPKCGMPLARFSSGMVGLKAHVWQCSGGDPNRRPRCE